jgi:hypothetical protein
LYSDKHIKKGTREMTAYELELVTIIEKQQTDLDVALSYMKQYELEIAQLKVAYEQEQYRSKQWQERFESGRLT